MDVATLPINHLPPSPFRSAAWRWDVAADYVRSGLQPDDIDNDMIRIAFGYQLGQAAGDDAARTKQGRLWAETAAAHAIFRDGGVLRDEIQARLLAAESFEQIAVKTGVDAVVVRVYEAIFFNVADSLNATDWLMWKAIGVPRGQCPTEGQIWAWLGLAGGPLVLDIVIGDTLNRQEPQMPDRPVLATKARLLARDFFAPMDPRAAAAIIDEGCRLFAEELKRDRSEKGERLRAQVNFLRWVAGLPAMSARGEEDKPRGGETRNGRRIARKDHHGREKATPTP